MKKTLILTMALSLMLAGSISNGIADENKDIPPKGPECGCPFKVHPQHPKMTKAEFEKMQKERKKEFEKKLKLTKKQKQQIEANRLVKQQEMEPIRKEIGNKIGKIHQIQTSNLSEAEKKKQIEAVKKEIAPLKAKADAIRLQNMKEFEALLTDKQKEILKEIKEEHKAKFQHKPPCEQGPCPMPPEQKK